MKKTFLIAMAALFCATSHAQVRPDMRVLFDRLTEIGEPPRVTKEGGMGSPTRLRYEVHLYYSPTMFQGVDSLELDTLLQEERQKFADAKNAIQEVLDHLPGMAYESYHYEYHLGGRDTIIYSMNLTNDTTRTYRYQNDSHTYFYSNEYVHFTLQPREPEGSYVGTLNYGVTLPEAEGEPASAQHVLSTLADDIDRLFSQHHIKPRKARWQHDEAYSDSVWNVSSASGNHDFISMMSYENGSRTGTTDATIYTIPREPQHLAQEFLAALDTLAEGITRERQEFYFRYHQDPPFAGTKLYCSFDLDPASHRHFTIHYGYDAANIYVLIAKTRGIEWIPRDWEAIKTFVNGQKTYFKGMKPKETKRLAWERIISVQR